MPNSTDPTRRRLLPSGLTGLAGVACAACCAIPMLLAAGVLGGADWAAAGRWMPGIAVALTALAAAAWWRASRPRRHAGCAGGSGCGCATPADKASNRDSVGSVS